ncbi:hypothetical protein ES708_24566 [subsurface metagenome]
MLEIAFTPDKLNFAIKASSVCFLMPISENGATTRIFPNFIWNNSGFLIVLRVVFAHPTKNIANIKNAIIKKYFLFILFTSFLYLFKAGCIHNCPSFIKRRSNISLVIFSQFTLYAMALRKTNLATCTSFSLPYSSTRIR